MNGRRLGAFIAADGSLASNTAAITSHRRVFLLKPYPDNLPVVPVCRSCNTGFAPDEEYLLAFLGSVLAGSTDPEKQVHGNAARVLTRNPSLRARIESARSEFQTSSSEKRIIWKPEVERIERVLLKNARGHAIFEIGEPMLEPPAYVRSAPLDEALTLEQRAVFEGIDFGPGWPEVGSRMMSRMLTGQDLANGWVVVQDSVYRYAVTQTNGILVKAVLFGYLTTEVLWEA
jgi:hypothetical protein